MTVVSEFTRKAISNVIYFTLQHSINHSLDYHEVIAESLEALLDTASVEERQVFKVEFLKELNEGPTRVDQVLTMLDDLLGIEHPYNDWIALFVKEDQKRSRPKKTFLVTLDKAYVRDAQSINVINYDVSDDDNWQGLHTDAVIDTVQAISAEAAIRSVASNHDFNKSQLNAYEVITWQEGT